MTLEELRAFDRWLCARLDGETEAEPPGGPEGRARAERLLQFAASPALAFEDLPTADPDWTERLSASLADTGTTGPGTRIGSFEMVEAIGAGGMGAVYRARRVAGGFEQRVALKILAGTQPDADQLRQFQREREVLSRLEHANIARLIDGGVTDDLRPWFAMEYVDGLPIDRYCDIHRLDTEQRLDLFLQVCRALEYAHGQLVLHRDIKPSNILVTAGRVVKLLDFGLGRIQENLGQIDSEQTQSVNRWLTPEFASPEQVRGDAVSVASEVYQLGVLLYRLLCGRPPYAMPATSPSPMEIVRIVCDTAPQRPSETWRTNSGRVEARAASCGSTPAAMRRRLQGDLDNILLTALDKEPRRRYASVTEVAEDIRRHLEHQPVIARAATRGYLLSKFVHRYRVAVSSAALVFVLIATALTVIMLLARQVVVERDAALRESARAALASQRAVAINDFLADLLTASNPFIRPGETPTVRALMDQAAQRVDSEFNDQPELAVELLGLIGRSYRDMGEFALARQTLSHALDRMAEVEVPAELVAGIRVAYAHSLISDSARLDEAHDLIRLALDELPNDGVRYDVRASALGTLATALALRGEHAAALESRLEATELACAHYAADPGLCIGGLVELKYFYHYVEDMPAALDVARRGWEAAEGEYAGQSHPLRLMAAGAYGDALTWVGEAAAAIPLLEQAADLAVEIYGEEHFRYARALDWLASAYIDVGKNVEAIGLLENALAIGRAAAPGNPITSVRLYQLAQQWVLLRQPARAVAALQEYEGDLPTDLPHPLADPTDFTRLQMALIEAPRDPGLHARLAAMREEFAARESHRLSDLLLLSAQLELATGDARSALDDLEEIERVRPYQRGLEVMHARLNLLRGQAWFALGDFDQAGMHARSALALLENSGHEQSALLADSREFLGELACIRGDWGAGAQALAAARSYWTEIGGVPEVVRDLERRLAVCGP